MLFSNFYRYIVEEDTREWDSVLPLWKLLLCAVAPNLTYVIQFCYFYRVTSDA